MTKKKSVPMRTCIACREMKPKKEMLRVVKNADGDISVDVTGKAPGRGAYICKNVACLTKAERSKRLARSLDCEIPAEVYAAMREELAAHDGN